MNILGYEVRKKQKQEQEIRSIYDKYDPMIGGFSYSSYSSYNSNKALTLSACYRAVNLISDSIASLQLKVYKVDGEGYKNEFYEHNLYNILGIEP
ncbi:hypothetical protein HXX01_05500, partial [Candidatus Nomurabacteria bacterium]|nr:hypothetical protein [Candidatus Nomurabacteria bacterium]